jgi:hypothetical protein
MKALVNAALLATLVTLLAGMAVAEPSETAGSQVWGSGEVQPRDESELWVPSLAITSGILVEDAEASVVSTLRANEDPPFFDDSGADTLIGPLVSGSLELMAPAWGDHWGRPRLFAHAGAGGNFAFERDVAKAGAPGTLELPDSGLLVPPVGEPGVVSGQGSTTSVQPRHLLLSAGGGIAFSFDAWGRRFRIKPSAEYLREEVEVTGVVSGATIDDPGVLARPNENPPIPGRPPTFNFFNGSGSERQVFHGIRSGGRGGRRAERVIDRVGSRVGRSVPDPRGSNRRVLCTARPDREREHHRLSPPYRDLEVQEGSVELPSPRRHTLALGARFVRSSFADSTC